LQQTVGSQTTTYVMDLNAGLTQVLSDGTNTYTYGLQRISQVGTADTEYFLGDALGSVRQLTDETGAVTLAKNYSPFGEVLSNLGSTSTPFGFTSEYTDSYIKLINLRSRLYSPAIGRFLTRDSWQGDYYKPALSSDWGYVGDNPVNRRDPTGQCWYWDPNTQETRDNPLMAPFHQPCESFVNILESTGIHLPSDATSSNWLEKIPPEARKYFLQEKLCHANPNDLQNEYSLSSPYPYLGTPKNQGRHLGTSATYKVSGMHTQFGIHYERDDAIGFGIPFVISASIFYNISYSLDISEYVETAVIDESYQLIPAQWVDTFGRVELSVATSNGSKHIISLGDLNFGVLTQTRRTPVTFYGIENFPNTLLIQFHIAMTETMMGRSTNNIVQLPGPALGPY
jgi:RHS repeat-associated protein